jgi:hypothetical protein
MARGAAYAMVGSLAVLALVGCGGGAGGDGDLAKIQQTLQRDFAAIANGDGGTACALATPSGQAKLEQAVPGASCEQIVTLVAQRLPERTKDALRSAQINRVTINGDTATVQDAGITSQRGSFSGFLHPGSAPGVLKRQPDGSWKIAG